MAAAQQRLDRAEAALADVTGAFDKAKAHFGDDSAQYIQAVDRFGRLFTDAEPPSAR